MKKALCIVLSLVLFALPALADRETAEDLASRLDGALGRAYQLTELYCEDSGDAEYAAAGIAGLDEISATFACRAEGGELACCVMLETGAADHSALIGRLLSDPGEYEEEMAVLTAFAAALAPDEDAEAVLTEALQAAQDSDGSAYYAFFGGDVVTGGADGEGLAKIVAGEWEFGIYATMELMVFSAWRAE